MMPMNLSDVAILNIKSVDYRCNITVIYKIEAINLMQNTDLTKKSGKLLTFGYIETEKNKFYHYKSHFPLGDVDVEKVLVSSMISFGEKTINALFVTCIMIIELHQCI